MNKQELPWSCLGNILSLSKCLSIHKVLISPQSVNQSTEWMWQAHNTRSYKDKCEMEGLASGFEEREVPFSAQLCGVGTTTVSPKMEQSPSLKPWSSAHRGPKPVPSAPITLRSNPAEVHRAHIHLLNKNTASFLQANSIPSPTAAPAPLQPCRPAWGELRSVLCQGSLPALANGSYASAPSLEASFYCFPNTAGSARCTFSGLLCGGCGLEIVKGRDT